MTQLFLLKISKNQLEKIKNGKAPGPDEIKPETYKHLLKKQHMINLLTKTINNILETNIVPNSWKTSNTKLIPKNKNPRVNELRPIALMDISYKILMGILKNKVEEHLKSNNLINDLQSGATPGRRVSENIFILHYCIEKSYVNKQKLYILSIDYRKAFDSVDRYMMLKVIQKLKIHPKIINIICNIYQNDTTSLYLNNDKLTEINISAGIKQGCNLSSLLFILITYEIIESIEKLDLGYKDDNFTIGSLFYIDDGLIFTRNIHDMTKLIFKMENLCLIYGLQLNKSKCNIMMINDKEDIDNIENINIVDKIKYLGIIIDNKKKCFQTQKAKIIENATIFNHQMYAILGNTCNRMLIGKTYYKGLVLPNILYADEIFTYTETELNNLQKQDNRAYRSILQVPRYTGTEFLRGEIGASSSKARHIKNKILFIKHALKPSGNDLLREIVIEEMNSNKITWFKDSKDMINKLNLTINDIQNMTIEKIKMKINKYDNQIWKQGMINKSSLKLYQENKAEVQEEKWFRNSRKYSIMMMARSNTLKLGQRDWENKSGMCPVCKKDVETLEHFIFECVPLQETRNIYIHLQLPSNLKRQEMLKEILIFVSDDQFNKTS